jgi:hypothetical protein
MSGPSHNNASYLQPAFLICTAVLALASGGMSVATKRLGLYLKKEPLPLKKSLASLDEALLAPYKVVGKQVIENEGLLESLGTEDYIQWVLEDPCQPAGSPVRRVMLFVTYYPEPDRVPHVPEECYTGSGYQRLETEDIMLRIGGPGSARNIPGRCLVFGSLGRDVFPAAARFPVLYLLRVNGQYAGSRDSARAALNRNIFSKYSYFSKVELAFNQALAAPTTEEAIEASTRLLGVLLPVLEREHWPQWPQP